MSTITKHMKRLHRNIIKAKSCFFCCHTSINSLVRAFALLALCSLGVCGTVTYLKAGQPIPPLRSVPSPKTNLIVKFSTTRSQQVGKPLHLSVYVQNLGREPVSIERRFIPRGKLVIFLYDRSGRDINYPGSEIRVDSAPPTMQSDFIILNPGYSYGIGDIATLYPIILKHRGVYEAEAVLSLSDYSKELGFKHWNGTLKSNRIRIKL